MCYYQVAIFIKRNKKLIEDIQHWGGSFLGDMELTRTPHYEYNEKSNLQHINSKSAGSFSDHREIPRLHGKISFLYLNYLMLQLNHSLVKLKKSQWNRCEYAQILYSDILIYHSIYWLLIFIYLFFYLSLMMFYHLVKPIKSFLWYQIVKNIKTR